MKILLGDFNAKVGRENIFKPTIGNESLHQDSNNNGVRLVNFATSSAQPVPARTCARPSRPHAVPLLLSHQAPHPLGFLGTCLTV